MRHRDKINTLDLLFMLRNEMHTTLFAMGTSIICVTGIIIIASFVDGMDSRMLYPLNGWLHSLRRFVVLRKISRLTETMHICQARTRTKRIPFNSGNKKIPILEQNTKQNFVCLCYLILAYLNEPSLVMKHRDIVLYHKICTWNRCFLLLWMHLPSCCLFCFAKQKI